MPLCASALLGSSLVGAALAVGLMPPMAPSTLKSTGENEYIRVAERPYTDARAVQLSMKLGPERSSHVAVSGRVTRSSCAQGLPVTSGTSPWTLGDTPVLALATEVPLWRTLRMGDRGADVNSLHRALRDLQYDVPPDGEPISSSTVDALVSVWNKLGRTVERSLALDTTSIAWVPTEQPKVTECTVGVGSVVTSGQTLLRFAPEVVGAQITALPSNLIQGERQLNVGERTVSVDSNGIVTNPDELVTMIDQNRSGEKSSDTQSTSISAEYSLSSPIRMTVVPPSSVVRSGGTCVITKTGPTKVEVVGSHMGQTYVTIPDGADVESVKIAPRFGVTCE